MAMIRNQLTVVRDSWHNIWSDLCIWKNAYWLVYGRAHGHSSPNAITVVLRSTDLARWHQTATLHTEHDARDPKIVPYGDRLFIFVADNRRRSFGAQLDELVYTCASTSEDGFEWSTPTRMYQDNYWLWRVRIQDGIFYSAEKGGELLTSPDGFTWHHHTVIPESGAAPTSEPRPDHRTTPSFNEADLLFRPDGELWCVSRSRRIPDDSILYWSSPPYDTWDSLDLGTRIHCPVLCESNGIVYLAGRTDPSRIWFPQHSSAGNTGIFRLDKTGITPVLALPSDGDAAYPGMISPAPGRLVVSYYSQHAYLSGTVRHDTYTQDFLQEPREQDGIRTSAAMTGPSDIFLTDIDVEVENARRNF